MSKIQMYSLIKPASKVKKERDMPMAPNRPSMSFSSEQFKSFKGKEVGNKVDIHLKGEIVGHYSSKSKYENSDRFEVEFDQGGLISASAQAYKDLNK